MKLLRGILAVVMTALVAFSALGVSFSAVLLPPATSTFANLFADETASGLEHSEIVAVAEEVRAFSMGDDEADLPLGTDYRTAFTQGEIDHLLEVRMVFYWALIVTAGCLIASAVIGLVLYRNDENLFIGRVLIAAGSIPLACVVLLAVFASIDFDAFFTVIHSLFFQDGTWTFPADSLLISALPEAFWMGMAALWAGIFMIVCILLIFIGRRMLKRRVHG